MSLDTPFDQAYLFGFRHDTIECHLFSANDAVVVLAFDERPFGKTFSGRMRVNRAAVFAQCQSQPFRRRPAPFEAMPLKP
jgi:hypothetical protein